MMEERNRKQQPGRTLPTTFSPDEPTILVATLVTKHPDLPHSLRGPRKVQLQAVCKQCIAPQALSVQDGRQTS